MRPGVLVLVLVAAVGAAWFASEALRQGPTPPLVEEGADLTPTGRASAAHLDLSPAEKLVLARNNLSRMAGDLPERLGPLKEELALLCDSPEVVRLIADSYPSAKSVGSYAVGAYADLFALVRHPLFVGPVAEMLRSEERLLRAKGVQAAVVQRSPELGGAMLKAYELALADDLSVTSNTRATAVLAAARTGGPEAAALLQSAFRDPSEDIRCGALDVAGELALPSLDAALRGVLRDPPGPREALRAAAALCHRDPAARAKLLASLDPRDRGLSHEAVSLVVKLKPPGAVDALRGFVATAEGEAKRGMRTALIWFGDPTERNQARADASTVDGPQELEALGLLAHGGDEDAIDILLAGLLRGGPQRIGVIGKGLAESGDPALLKVAERLLEARVRHPAEVGEFAVRFGDALVPKAVAELKSATDPERARYLTATLMGIGTPLARAALLAERPTRRRLVDPALRILDLALRSRGDS